MRKIALAALAAFVLALLAAPCAFAQEAKKEHAYMGTAQCAMCHKSAAKGDQFGKWTASKHSKAFADLATPAAKEIATKAGVTGEAQASDKCLACHTTAHGVKAELVGAKFKKEDGVSCEACHGPGKDYQVMTVMKDKALAIAAGLVMPTEATCKGCHNDKAPHPMKPFDFAKASAVIAHPYPPKPPAQ